MTLAYAQRANDAAYLTQHYDILDQWTQYLIQEALIPANQISTDDFAGSLANQTNLALKGIIGIEAMAVVANLTGNAEAAENYTSIAHDYITEWQTLGQCHELPLSQQAKNHRMCADAKIYIRYCYERRPTPHYACLRDGRNSRIAVQSLWRQGIGLESCATICV